MEVDPVSAGRRRRVAPMSPEDRRASLIVVTLPLLRRFGLAVTTRQIAEAAGIAEGTIFGAFPDKQSLISAAVLSAFDPVKVVCALRDVDPAADVRDRLKRSVQIMGERFEDNAPLVMLARSLPAETTHELFTRLHEGRRGLIDTIAAVLEPDRARLRRDPATAARLLLSLMFAGSRGDAFGDPVALTGEEIVDVLLDGLLITGPATTDQGDADPC